MEGDHAPGDESQFQGDARYGDGLPTISPAGILWHAPGFEFTVGMRVENSGHFSRFIPKEPFHPTVFAAEERVVLTGEKFDHFPVCPSFNEFVAHSLDPNVAFVAARRLILLSESVKR